MTQRQRQATPRRDYYWLCAVEATTGTPIVDGPYNTPDEARQVGWEKLNQEFEVLPMKTIDKRSATAEYRHIRLMRFGNLSEVLKRTKHKL